MTEAASYRRKFLVVIDESDEAGRAVTFAAHRVKRTGGTVVLLSVLETQDFSQFIGVEQVMRAEARAAAERALDAQCARIAELGDIRTETVIREGELVSEIEGLLADDPDIAILVLAAADSPQGPGPLVSTFTSRAAQTRLPVIVTIVPGGMTEEQIISVT